ncbi:MAG: metalloregulator ArsR/SmtB family transcription factor [Pseudomonadota bacterium]
MELSAAAAGFAALSQETRLSVLRLLVRAGPDGVAAGALSDATGVAPPTLSFHLKELTAAGLAASRRDGRRILYAADYAGLGALIDFLVADCCQGDPRACGAALSRLEPSSPRKAGRKKETAP